MEEYEPLDSSFYFLLSLNTKYYVKFNLPEHKKSVAKPAIGF